MKIRTHLKAAALFAAMFATTTLSAQDTLIRSNELPKNAQQHLRKAFGSQRIVQAEKETTLGVVKDYKAILANGTEVEFERNGQWKEMENKKAGIPYNAMPAAISNYLKRNYARVLVEKIEKENRGYKVDLSNGLELEFDSKGKFLRIDS